MFRLSWFRAFGVLAGASWFVIMALWVGIMQNAELSWVSCQATGHRFRCRFFSSLAFWEWSPAWEPFLICILFDSQSVVSYRRQNGNLKSIDPPRFMGLYRGL